MQQLDTDKTLLTRRAASEFLKSYGYPVAVATLATFVTRGGGPVLHKFGPRALYRPADLLEWAQSRLSPPRHSSSQNDLSSREPE